MATLLFREKMTARYVSKGWRMLKINISLYTKLFIFVIRWQLCPLRKMWQLCGNPALPVSGNADLAHFLPIDCLVVPKVSILLPLPLHPPTFLLLCRRRRRDPLLRLRPDLSPAKLRLLSFIGELFPLHYFFMALSPVVSIPFAVPFRRHSRREVASWMRRKWEDICSNVG